jgi:hypothetical protein
MYMLGGMGLFNQFQLFIPGLFEILFPLYLMMRLDADHIDTCVHRGGGAVYCRCQTGMET